MITTVTVFQKKQWLRLKCFMLPKIILKFNFVLKRQRFKLSIPFLQ